MTQQYLEKTYAGFLGMNIGIRLGAPVEPTIWTYERILNTYGDITDYVKEFKNFAADDDSNGPVFFLRALYDDAKDRELTPNDVARAWLNYSRDGKGMFWWGGYGTSTEHTTYINLKKGITAPRSGSIAQNGKTLAEQIGGQIFIDTWGLVNPGNPTKAAHYGEMAASVSHDGDGVNGARFFCAAIAAAYESKDIYQVVDRALAELSKDSLYYKVAEAVKAFFAKEPNDFRACRAMLERDWGYDKYPGVCHMIPNAGVCILSMLYGKGNLSRTVEIATMCGWDTDCNAGNVGTVLGVLCGLEGVEEKYRIPMNDGIVLSSIAGSLNILDIPTYSKELCLLGYRLAGENPPAELLASYKEHEIYFDFELQGSTHNIRVSDPFFCNVKHSTEQAASGTGSLKILMDRMTRGDQCKVFYKPYYTREDFSDERYSPVFTPTVYSGQTVSFQLYNDQWTGNETVGIAPYVRLSSGKEDLLQGYIKLEKGKWTPIEFTIPDSKGDLICEVGFVIEGYSPKEKTLGHIYMDEFRIFGKSKYTVDFAKQKGNFGCVSPFSHNYGAWEKQGDKLHVMSSDYAESYAGNYFSKNYTVESKITPVFGENHLLACRAQGAMRGYFGGLAAEGKVALYKNDFGVKQVAEAAFAWEIGKEYAVQLTAVGNRIGLSVNGKELLSMEDGDYSYGMYGACRLSMGRTLYGTFAVEEV